MKIGIVIPTFNEVENLSKLVSDLFAVPMDISLLVVDDNSPDGTGLLADELAFKESGRMEVLHRPERLGLASAYVQGFRHFLKAEVDAIGQMDADYSHNPSILTTMANHLKDYAVVIGSRYARGGGIDKKWPYWRKALSVFGNNYVRLILRLPYRDLTSGFRLWRLETLESIPLERIQSNGYVFQIEMVYLAHRLKFPIGEIPIFFAERQKGESKMSFQIQIEAALRIWQLPLTYRDMQPPGKAAIRERMK
ncbi:polyprenol monophosphomannose synthase [Chloroflexota bacterium]